MKRLLVFLLLTGCITNNHYLTASYESDLPLYYVDSELVLYLASFKKEAHNQGFLVSNIPATVIFGKAATTEHPNAVGWCSVTNGRLFIKIDRKYYFKGDTYQREELVYHEIGHCLASREHCEYKDPVTKRRVSIMSADMGEGNDYKEHRDEYIKELFHVNPNCP